MNLLKIFDVSHRMIYIKNSPDMQGVSILFRVFVSTLWWNEACFACEKEIPRNAPDRHAPGILSLLLYGLGGRSVVSRLPLPTIRPCLSRV